MAWVPVAPVSEDWALQPVVEITTEDGIVLTTEDGVAIATEQNVRPDRWTAVPITETT